jgi:hypothetical protein
MDPVLRLYKGCRVMLPSNTDVLNGLANGTQAKVTKVNLCAGVEPIDVMINAHCKIKAVYASQIDYVELEHLNDRITPKTFVLKPTEHKFRLNMSRPRILQTKKNRKKNQ